VRCSVSGRAQDSFEPPGFLMLNYGRGTPWSASAPTSPTERSSAGSPPRAADQRPG
jgi:hypothetical protein